ncbi:DUF1192 domain-containing protein [Oryzicola mucosus]|uniref:DUF1192 domain-containing protein n=1 Tax=Oryzicola mucosus TaxID=2767425 RepID=A0A8J6PFQ0_9HYPH|nr:DUF1192 domain-containing protein [Oryzicola mucosus]MBD0414259.1 DUF1192 domain-containing protein [Oryzicola mucosus]
MAVFDEEPRRTNRQHEIGQDLSLLSVADLQERIAILKAEAGRLEAEIASKTSSKSVAESLFKPR